MSETLGNMVIKELGKANKHLKLQLEHSNAQNLTLESQNLSLKLRLDQLRFQVDQLNRMIFGAKRERFVPNNNEGQLALPFDVAPEKGTQEEQQTITYVRKKKKRENHPGRLALPSHLPVEEIIIEPNEDTSGMKCIGREITDQLELVPARLFIKRYIRPKYIKAQDEESLYFKGVIGSLPVFPIEKGIAGPGLLAQIMIDKFVDHLPIYRQIERFKREQVKIPSSAINGWQESVCNLLEPLYGVLRHRVSC